jgi:phosphoglycolate phosphatase
MDSQFAGLIVWDVDGTLVPGDLRFLRRAVARAYRLEEAVVEFGPPATYAGTTDDYIARQAAILSGVPEAIAEEGLARFRAELVSVMSESRKELVQEFTPFPGAAQTIEALHDAGYVQTVLTGNLRQAAEIKLRALNLSQFVDLDLGGYGSDSGNRLDLPDVIKERFKAAKNEALDLRRTVLIGDTARDVACARHGGFRVIVVSHGFGTRDELVSSQPDALVDRLDSQTVIDAVVALKGSRSPSGTQIG